jgi:hypothetical protein
MAIQFAGSSSTGDRRRRRIVVHGESTNIDAPVLEGDAAEMESQLVASAAAGPWVPVNESRIWIYAGLIALFLAAMTFAWAEPSSLHASIRPVTNHLLTGTSPILVTCTEFLLLALSAQLSHLIGWYRSRGKLDFDGRYRFWPWATTLFALAAFGVVTNSHRALGEAVSNTELLTWRSETIAWLLPVCLISLPIALCLDRDIRNSRTSLWTIRVSLLLWISEAWLELFQPDLQFQPWFEAAFLLIPVFASAALFVGLWLHARVVAYVCPDPPELNEQSAWSLFVAACRSLSGLLMFRRSHAKEDVEEEDESKPKRRKKKTDTAEEATTKRKKKAPAKRTTPRTRTRTKVADEEAVEEAADASAADETDTSEEAESESNTSWDESDNQSQSEQWDEPAEVEEESVQKSNTRITQVHKPHSSPMSGPHRRQNESWEEEAEIKDQPSGAGSYDSSNDDADEDLESGPTADQMKGLSKRQKRELKRQLREQEKTRNR